MRVAKVSQVLWPVTEDFVIGTGWSRAKERISEGDGHGAFQKLVATHTSTVLAENRNSCAFSEVLLSLELCQSVTCRGALFSENSKSYVWFWSFFFGGVWIALVVACAGAVFYENLVLPCFFNRFWRLTFGMVLLFSRLFCARFCSHFNHENHHTVLMAIASLTPLLSSLKGAPSGTYRSSHQQKK